EALHTEGVEDAGPDPREVRLAGGDVSHDLLLESGPVVPPSVDGLDAQCAAGKVRDALDEVRDGRLVAQIVVAVCHLEDYRLARTSRLGAACSSCGATRPNERRDEGKYN